MRLPLFVILLLNSVFSMAQPDTLFVPSGDTLFSFAVQYGPMKDVEQFTRIGRYTHDTTLVAVRLQYKRGKPSGTYRAFFPDGRPLIFAVYGWGSLSGDWTEYDEFGRITTKGQYSNGLRDGTWAFRTEEIVGKYKAGLKHGKWRTFSNGRLIRIDKFHNGEPVQGGSFRMQ